MSRIKSTQLRFTAHRTLGLESPTFPDYVRTYTNPRTTGWITSIIYEYIYIGTIYILLQTHLMASHIIQYRMLNPLK